jgi:hypothetical protein
VVTSSDELRVCRLLGSRDERTEKGLCSLGKDTIRPYKIRAAYGHDNRPVG